MVPTAELGKIVCHSGDSHTEKLGTNYQCLSKRTLCSIHKIINAMAKLVILGFLCIYSQVEAVETGREIRLDGRSLACCGAGCPTINELLS